jgi:hypothetical protein
VHIGGINWELQKEIYGIGLPLYHEWRIRLARNWNTRPPRGACQALMSKVKIYFICAILTARPFHSAAIPWLSFQAHRLNKYNSLHPIVRLSSGVHFKVMHPKIGWNETKIICSFEIPKCQKVRTDVSPFSLGFVESTHKLCLKFLFLFQVCTNLLTSI